MAMHRFATATMMPITLVVLLAGCRQEPATGAAANPAPTAEAHEPEGSNRYGTSAQDTRDHSAGERADSPNHDPDDEPSRER